MTIKFLSVDDSQGRMIQHTGFVESNNQKLPFNLYDLGRLIDVKGCDPLGKEYGAHPYEDEIVKHFNRC